MKQYTKPTIAIAANSSESSVSTCFQKVDTELITSILGYDLTLEQLRNTFSTGEPCKFPIPIDFYCKFTSVDMGALQAFIS